MASATSNSSHARSRSLRSNTLSLKPPVVPIAQLPQGPSSIALFVTNLRLLDLDLRDDWPDITPSTFSTRDQKKRIQSVEWALYHLFVLWDLEEASDKLQPFFPPLEPLQSLNLRAALLRCLEQAKKTGILGRETILRKTMLDECKGERLEEILAVFSNAVLKRVLQDTNPGPQALAQQLALENFSYSGERSLLSALIVAHKASLSKHLREKEASRAQYQDFSNLLDLNERRIARRHEQLKQVVAEQGSRDKISSKEITALQLQVQKNWSGADAWLDTILYGDSIAHTDGVLATPFDKLWKHVENGSIGEIEGNEPVGLLEQLDTRVKGQEARLARWKSFGKTLKKSNSPVKSSKEPASVDEAKIDLGFTRHQSMQLPRNETKGTVVGCQTASLVDYTGIMDNMKAELANVGKPTTQLGKAAKEGTRAKTPDRSPSRSPVSKAHVPPISTGQETRDQDEDWTSASDTEEVMPTKPAIVNKPAIGAAYSLTSDEPKEPQSLPKKTLDDRINLTGNSQQSDINIKARKIRSNGIEPTAAPRPQSQTIPEPTSGTTPPPTEQSVLADQILESVSAASPSPKKRHTLSLAERTRLSMSRASHTKYSELHDEMDDLPRVAVKPAAAAQHEVGDDADAERHADLISRTRKSMAGFEAAQKRAQMERRRSVKDAKKKTRESTYFPRVEEELPARSSLDSVVLMEGDPDYESVFKSRPKIATSPAPSPSRILEEEENER